MCSGQLFILSEAFYMQCCVLRNVMKISSTIYTNRVPWVSKSGVIALANLNIPYACELYINDKQNKLADDLLRNCCTAIT